MAKKKIDYPDYSQPAVDDYPDYSQPGMTNTFLGDMETPSGMNFDPKIIQGLIESASGAPGINSIGRGAITGAVRGAQYLNPGRNVEPFRATIGQGTSTENINDLAKRIQFARQSAKDEALIPKNELYRQEGKSDVYKVDPKGLPEGNLQQVGEMIDSGNHNFSPVKMDALSKALKNYRKSGDVDSFLENSQDIFNVEELPDKAAEQIHDALSMPTARESKYLGDEDVDSFYGKKGNLRQKHDAYVNKPVLNNYDTLQSALKKQQRILDKRAKGGTITDTGEAKLDQLNLNIKNLDSDKENFMQTLPDKIKNLENEFRTKYATGVGKYEDAGDGAKNVIRKLAKGKASEVSSAQIGRVFTRPTQQVKDILTDLGPSAGRNILYNALQKVPVGDAEGMANTILDLRRTKGYDQFVTPEMESWANNMLTHVSRANLIKRSLGSLGGAVAGSAALGPVGGMIGLGAPWAYQGAKSGAKFIAKKLIK